ncbi:indolepyruvate ferredoxin oxidoreductase subunit alpha [Ferroplasma sp.]|uniref:indolepyruvate ferredoxin oxidoreductase subunit alpha n=1 Tax=Ferroplasma sp. TaxID=2591003 RepID=UPI00262AB814|nr:indolepyruvate ferredoxin oxidoreductase subunit alpha [Ferroplasma sp.]
MVDLIQFTESKIEKNPVFLLGNEAIARGAVEAGIEFASSYPGTPSSEVGETLSHVADKLGIKFLYSVNEKVALESAFAASISGMRSLVFMKHVGLNVASDPFISIVYTGTAGGLVIMTADDPSMFSSQNEQDNRHYADLAHIPMIEPSNPQEAKDFVKAAFELSEKYHIPVLFRTTTRVSHMRGPVNVGEIPKIKGTRRVFERDPKRFVSLPVNAIGLKKMLMEKLGEIAVESDMSFMNNVQSNMVSEIGAITSGSGYNSLMDAVTSHSIEIDVLKIGFTNPLPQRMIAEFLRKHDKVVIVEELDPYMEEKIRAIAQINGIRTRIYGKLDGYFPMVYELNPDAVLQSLARILNMPGYIQGKSPKTGWDLPPRPPVLCPGCPHRGTYYVVKRSVRMSNIKNPIYASDIGCYSLGTYDPFDEADTLISMGSSIGVANGFSMVTDQKVIAFIGDSTFYHSGIPPLINAVHNNLDMLVIIMDNGTTAMTGQQPNPGNELDYNGKPVTGIPIEDVVRGIGVSNVSLMDPYNLKESFATINRSLHQTGVSVIISRRECAIIRDRKLRKNGEIEIYTVNQDKCGKCMNCVENFSCPALFIENGEIQINPSICDGCGVCAETLVCPFNAIEVKK